MKDEDWIEAIGAPACTDCRFFEPSAGERGWCRRFPKGVQTQTHQWCGEFELTPSARRAFEAERLERWNGRLK
jgi:hypothetical protein